MIESDGIILDDDGIISVEYSDPSLFPDDNVFELEDFFEIPGFVLTVLALLQVRFLKFHQ